MLSAQEVRDMQEVARAVEAAESLRRRDDIVAYQEIRRAELIKDVLPGVLAKIEAKILRSQLDWGQFIEFKLLTVTEDEADARLLCVEVYNVLTALGYELTNRTYDDIYGYHIGPVEPVMGISWALPVPPLPPYEEAAPQEPVSLGTWLKNAWLDYWRRW